MTPYQIFIIAFSSCVGIILILINIYILNLYVHPQDKGITNAPYAKIVIILGLTICQAQALLVPLDVSFQSNYVEKQAYKIGLFWLFLYATILAFICIFIPLSIFYYESDPQQSFCRRICRTIGYWFLTVIVSSLIVFISYNFLKYVDLPYTLLIIQSDNSKTYDPVQQTITGIQMSAPVYFIAILTFIGWIFLVFFGGVGLFALPMDLINQFRHRPKVRKSNQMKAIKNKLVQAIKNLIQQGQQLQDSNQLYQRNQQASWLQKFKSKRSSNTTYTKFKVRYHLLKQQFTLFNLQLKLADTNPILPYMKLIIGIIFAITSLLWVIQIIFGNIIKGYFVDRPLIPFLNQMLIYMQERNAGLVSTIIYAYLCYYLMWCVQKGSIKMGIRLPLCCRFYPMKQSQTAINGLLVNILFLMIASVSVTQLCISSFPTYTRFAQINSIFQVNLRYMKFYKFLYEKSIFPIALIGWTFLTLLYLLVTCNRKPKYMRDVEQIRRLGQEERQALY